MSEDCQIHQSVVKSQNSLAGNRKILKFSWPWKKIEKFVSKCLVKISLLIEVKIFKILKNSSLGPQKTNRKIHQSIGEKS